MSPTHRIHMEVEVVVRVVDSLEKSLELSQRSPMDTKDIDNPDG